MQPKKLLILGTDYGSIQLVQEAKKMGFFTIVTDYLEPGKSEAKLEADEFWMISTAELDALEKKCQEEKIGAVLCGASDFNTEMALQLSERLGLKFYCSKKAWSYSRNKRAFKDLCMEVGAPVPKDYYISSALTEEELAKVEYPVVVKPIDMCAGKGVSFCYSKQELIQAYHYARYLSESDVVIVEKLLKGRELTGCYVFADGEISLVNCTITLCQTEGVKEYSSLGCTAGNYYVSRIIKEINPFIVKILRKIGCTDGFGWVQLFLDEGTDTIYIVEMGYRLFADMNYIFTQSFGFNVLHWLIEAPFMRHMKNDLPVSQKESYLSYVCSYALISKSEGKIAEIRGIDNLIKKEHFFVMMKVRPGDEVRSGEVLGRIVFEGIGIEKICAFVEGINKNVKIISTSNEDMLVYYMDIDSLEKNK